MDGAAQIVTPAFVSLLCICIVFVPMFALKGIAGYLFVPMAEAVVFAMIASFVLSRTLVPVLAMYLLKPHDGGHAGFTMEPHGHGAPHKPSRNAFVRFQHGFETRFASVRERYRAVLIMALEHRARFIAGFLAFVVLSFALAPVLGSNFFPSVDAGSMVLHVRAPVGTRLEDTAALFDRVEQSIRQTIPPDQLKTIVDNIGLPVSGINRAYSNTGGIGPQDGDIYITLAEKHRPTADYVRLLRRRLPQAFPTSSARSSTSARRPPSTCRSPAPTRRRTRPTPWTCCKSSSAFPASPTRGYSSPATTPSSASRSTAPARASWA
jgi:multidrug efflux pump subunit AcrB